MKRMHLHVSVDDLNKSISFYNTLFGEEPTVVKPDYAKWMLEDPLVNFAISQRGAKVGLDHVGIQVDSDDALSEMKARFDSAELGVLTQENTACCYAKSDKHWVQDPSGIAWETYHTLESAPIFSDSVLNDADSNAASACCAPPIQQVQLISRRNKSQ